jgi:hypothetical protein
MGQTKPVFTIANMIGRETDCMRSTQSIPVRADSRYRQLYPSNMGYAVFLAPEEHENLMG